MYADKIIHTMKKNVKKLVYYISLSETVYNVTAEPTGRMIASLNKSEIKTEMSYE